jgi:formate hydrogenlyase subunit 3/multisubunit Na+/H+ antiporter MnhD subunit
MHKDTFNTDFYVVAGTIIPVLYLALTLQGQTFERVISTSIKQARASRRLAWLRAWTLLATGGLIVATGFIGEWTTMTALYNRSADSSTSQKVLFCIFLLLIAVTAGPALRYYRAPMARKDAHEESPER